ncbi:flagellin [Hankyongella ginsenosidimutans]|uniref:Flagellin n=1 Tax=Hankyongella ginsenosidimutans TaxID=1763828 RepID=A0A4D7CA85_9SPHN|nr:flagellin [Hankyongella ginsenosidimutans]QCI80187.1 flagellin [Hankyongella ginsenosidimutans]
MAFSVNTNTGAFVALQNLSTTNRSLAEVQNRVNTGLRVSSAKDDSASYSIAQGLRGDVAGLSAVQTSLNRAKSSLDVAVQAGESISDLLNRAREIAVAASDAGLDTSSRTALNNDFKSIVSQIGSVVSQAEFNGTNLIKATPDSISAITAVKQNSTVDRISLSGVDLNANGKSAEIKTSAATVTLASGNTLAQVLAGGSTGALTTANTQNAAFARATTNTANGVKLVSSDTIELDLSAASPAAVGNGTNITLTVGGAAFQVANTATTGR